MSHADRGHAVPPRLRPGVERALKLIVPLVTVWLCVVGVEGLLRLPAFEGWTDLDPALKSGPLRYLPNQETPHRLGHEINTVIRINSFGFKDDEFSPTDGSRTMVALGDSFTEGWGVPLEATWVKRLETRFVRDGQFDHVFNAGHNGTNPKNYAELYDEVFSGSKAPSVKLVILGFCLLNDVVEASTPRRRPVADPGIGTQLKFFVSRHSYLYNVMRRRVRYNEYVAKLLAATGFGHAPFMTLELQNSERNHRRWPYTASFLTDFAKRVEAEGRQVVVVLVPAKETVDDEYFEALTTLTGSTPEHIDRFGLGTYLEAELARAGVRSLDLTPIFRQRHANGDKRLFFVGDSHWTEEGHHVAADAIYRYLADQRLLQ